MRIHFLGTGSSAGTPVIGCDCPVCRGDEPRNQRSRASIVVENEGTRILIDTGPDLRTQMLRAGIQSLDAVFYTHFHADHINGIDDLRAFNFLAKKVIPCFADARTAAELEGRFRYCFLPPDPGWGDIFWQAAPQGMVVELVSHVGEQGLFGGNARSNRQH